MLVRVRAFRILSHLVLGVLIAALSAPVGAASAESTESSRSTIPSSILQATSGGHALGFTAGGMYAATGTHALRVEFVGANQVQPRSSSASAANGQVAPLGRVTYADLWDGITLTYTAEAGSILTSTYTLAPGADPNAIRLRYNAPLSLNNDGTLSIAFATGALTETAPIAWQDIGGQRVRVEAGFTVRGQEATFTLGTYDRRYVLTIDPSLIWNTFLGGGGGAGDYGSAIAVDGSGNVYVAGHSFLSWGSPVRAFTSDSFQDAFAAKLGPSGALVWNTFLGASAADQGHGIAVDGDGNVYIVGYSGATWGTPVRAFTVTCCGGQDAFAAKLNSSGVLVWNTFLGTSGTDRGGGIAVDGSGNVHVTGNSAATWGSPVRAYTSGDDAFAAQLDSSGALTWNTFLGATGTDEGRGIAVDGSGNVYVVGSTFGTSWGSPVRTYTGAFDAFAAKLDSSGALTWNTFLGGSGFDYGDAIAVDDSGNVYVSGPSSATWGTPVRAYTLGDDAFAAKLDSSGTLTWNTFLGAIGADAGHAIDVDASGRVYVAGTSTASWGSPDRAYSSSADAFASALGSSGTLVWNTFLGGSSVDSGFGLAVDGGGRAYVTGFADASWGAPVRAFSCCYYDAFVVQLEPWLSVHSVALAGVSPTNAASVDFTLTFREPVTGVDSTDFNLTTTGSISGAVVSAVVGSGSAYTVTVDTGVGTGTIRLDVVDDDTIVDTATGARPLGGTDPGNGNFTEGEAYNLPAPTVVSSTRSSPNPTFDASVGFKVVFSESVAGVDVADFAVTTTGSVSDTTVSAVSGAGKTYTVMVSTGTGAGTIRLDVADDDSVLDVAGNPLADWGEGNGDFTSGESYELPALLVPSLLSPADGAEVPRIRVFRWSRLVGPVRYQLELDNDPGFSSPEFSASGRLANRRPHALPADTYFWHVRALDPRGNWTDWSPTFTINIQ